MKVILKENKNSTEKNLKIVKVKNGYAKNFLIPLNKALFASKKNIKTFLLEKTEDLKKSYINENTTILIGVNTKINENTYKSISNNTLFKLFKNLNIKIKQNQVSNKILINKIGTYDFKITNKKNNTINHINLILIKIHI